MQQSFVIWDFPESDYEFGIWRQKRKEKEIIQVVGIFCNKVGKGEKRRTLVSLLMESNKWNLTYTMYSKTCLKRPLKNRQNKVFKDKW